MNDKCEFCKIHESASLCVRNVGCELGCDSVSLNITALAQMRGCLLECRNMSFHAKMPRYLECECQCEEYGGAGGIRGGALMEGIETRM